MHTLSAAYHTTTPMFLAGADQSSSELRASSVKGLLRFWWRALRYPSLGGDLHELRQEENRLFGSTETGQAAILLRLTDVKQGQLHQAKAVHPAFAAADRAGARYLGYGLMEAFASKAKGRKPGQLTRGCRDQSCFSLKLISRRPLATEVCHAAELLGLVGGLGSRARKGFGSLTLDAFHVAGAEHPHDVADHSKSLTPEQLTGRLQEILKPARDYRAEPEISAFSAHTRIDLLHAGSDPIRLLNEYGMRMQQYRSWGQSEKGNLVNGRPSEKRFKDDHDWSKGSDHLRRSDFHPERASFGLPHNYGKGSSLEVKPAHWERRGSPLLYHVHQADLTSFLGITIVMQSQFLPSGDEISAGGKAVTNNVNYKIIDSFLEARDREDGVDTNSYYFPQRQRIWPTERTPA